MTNAKIPVLDLQPEIERHWQAFNGAFQGVLKSGLFINGPDVPAFESELAAYAGAKHAIGMNSGTDALVIALKALGIKPGDEVITTSFTFFATGEAVSLLGAKPVFVDIDPATYNIDPTLIEAKITSKTKAIIPVHLYGHAAPMDEILAIARKHDLKVLEDVAQAFSGSYKGKKLGTIGHAGALSFFPSKNLGAFGDGGALLTNDDKVAELSKMLRVHGAKKKYHNEILGYNSRLDTVQAAILRVKLPHLDQASAGRKAAAQRYTAAFQAVKGVTPPVERPYADHVYHQYTVRIAGDRRDAVKAALAADGIETMVYYPIPMHKLPVYPDHANDRLPLSEAASAQALSLPIWPEITKDVQDRVVQAVSKALK